jgi:hypothetical protein
VTTVEIMNLTEVVEPVIPVGVEQAVTTWLVLGIAVWLLLIALFFLILYAVIVTAIRRGMRDHLLWAESRDRSRTATAPPTLR